ncbi:hypothetical protein KVV02_004861 [Mortierella alpina]|uniref:Uncharacterized protein n=1 Tax=Mortierella alpina TaxID=64518 RepID=A0A9P8AAT0_MORAP|nr:hypothetical protein KVV02_004861 [Mortierella alpina]
MNKARRLLSRLRKQPSALEESAAHVSVLSPGAKTVPTGELGENPDEVNVRINHELLQDAIEWAMLLDGSRGASDDNSSKRPFEYGVESLAKKLGLSFFIDLIPGGHLLVCVPLSYFKVYRPLMRLNIPEARRKALRTTMRKSMAIDCAMGVFYLFGSVPRHFFGSNHRMTQEGRRWVFEHADLCNQGFNDLYASQGPASESHNECPYTPMIQQSNRGRTRSPSDSYCERKPVKQVQPASAHPPQKAEWAGTIDDQLDYLLYTPEPAPLQVAGARTAVRSSPVTEVSNMATESGNRQTSPPPPGEQPRRFVLNKRFSEKLYNPAAATRNDFYHHASAGNLERSSNHRSMQRVSSMHEDGLRNPPRQPPPASLQRVSKSPVRNAKSNPYLADSEQWSVYESRLEQPRIGLLQDAFGQEKTIRRPVLEAPLHIRHPRPLRISPQMRNKDIPFTGPLLESAIPKIHSNFCPPFGNGGSSSIMLSNAILATYSKA